MDGLAHLADTCLPLHDKNMGPDTFKGSRPLRMLAWAGALLLPLALLAWFWHNAALAQGREQTAVSIQADLGGVQVRIPAAFAHQIEFEGAPGLPAPGSRIRGFGFDVRYPDMQGVSNATQAARDQAPMETSMWLHVTLTAADHYYGADFLAHMAQELHRPKAWKYPLRQLAEPVHGLTAHVSQGGDVNDFRHMTLYTHRNAEGRVDTYIECHDGTYPSTPCTLYADMGPAMKATLSIHFRKGLLPSWRGMQAAVQELVRSFARNASRGP